MSVMDATSFFYDHLSRIIHNFVPKKKSFSNFPKWYSVRLINIIHEKLKYWKKFKKHGFDCDRNRYSELGKKENALISRCFNKYVKNIEDNVKTTMKELWSYTKSLKKSNTYPSSLTYLDQSKDDPSDVATLFSDYFSSVYDPPNLSNFSSVDFQHGSFKTFEVDAEQL